MLDKNDWLALVYKIPPLPSRFRVKIWRQLKKTGAIYYQQCIAVLPNSEHFLDFFKRIKTQIISCNGEAMIMNFHFIDEAETENAVRLFNCNISQQYLVIADVIAKVKFEIENINIKDLPDIGILREKLSDLRKLRKNYNTIKLKDCFKQYIEHRHEENIDLLHQRVQQYIADFENQ